MKQIILDILNYLFYFKFFLAKNDSALFDFLIDFIENDPSYLIRQHIVENICKYPPFKLNSEESCLNNENLVNRLWNLIG